VYRVKSESSTSGDYVVCLRPPRDNYLAIGLEPPRGNIRTTLAGLEIGAMYNVTWHERDRPPHRGTFGNLTVKIGGCSGKVISASHRTKKTWEQKSAVFKATSKTTELCFTTPPVDSKGGSILLGDIEANVLATKMPRTTEDPTFSGVVNGDFSSFNGSDPDVGVDGKWPDVQVRDRNSSSHFPNNSFDIPGWTAEHAVYRVKSESSTSGDYVVCLRPPRDNYLAIGLEPPRGNIRTTLAGLEIGAMYNVTWHERDRPPHRGTFGNLTVKIGGCSGKVISASHRTKKTWEQKSAVFKATSKTTELCFTTPPVDSKGGSILLGDIEANVLATKMPRTTEDQTQTPTQDPTKICQTCVPEEKCTDWQERMDTVEAYARYGTLEAPLSGVMPGATKPHIILAQDINYPPYAYLGDATSDFDVDGFGHDIALELPSVCDIDVTVVETRWANCWNEGEIGTGLLNGAWHGCMTYTHTVGQRNRFVEFSEPILQLNKPAGLIVPLVNGQPKVSPNSSLAGLKVVDVVGWAPTADGMAFVRNTCNECASPPCGTTKNVPENLQKYAQFEGYTIVAPTGNSANANDAALLTILNGDADAMFVYADQAYNYKCSSTLDTSSWDCDLWEGLGTDFAYIHSGMYLYAYGGTTLSMSKKGSNLKNILDPCIKALKETEAYYKICEENGLTTDCYPNGYFPNSSSYHEKPYKKNTNEQTESCEDGYCGCPGKSPQ